MLSMPSHFPWLCISKRLCKKIGSNPVNPCLQWGDSGNSGVNVSKLKANEDSLRSDPLSNDLPLSPGPQELVHQPSFLELGGTVVLRATQNSCTRNEQTQNDNDDQLSEACCLLNMSPCLESILFTPYEKPGQKRNIKVSSDSG